VTLLPHVLLARYLGDSTEAARRYFERLWTHVRPAVVSRAAATPRIWRT
jgi:urease accessory protein